MIMIRAAQGTTPDRIIAQTGKTLLEDAIERKNTNIHNTVCVYT